jgi:hypothetical protein
MPPFLSPGHSDGPIHTSVWQVPYLLGLIKLGRAATAQGEEPTLGKAPGGSVGQPVLAHIRSVQATPHRAFRVGLAKK